MGGPYASLARSAIPDLELVEVWKTSEYWVVKDKKKLGRLFSYENNKFKNMKIVFTVFIFLYSFNIKYFLFIYNIIGRLIVMLLVYNKENTSKYHLYNIFLNIKDKQWSIN